MDKLTEDADGDDEEKGPTIGGRNAPAANAFSLEADVAVVDLADDDNDEEDKSTGWQFLIISLKNW